VYQITNLVNGKIYIGKHQTNDLNDQYFGSGKLINRAIEKYSLDAFSKDILFVFDNEQEMNTKEKEIVTEEFCKLSTNYNLCPGGQGGFGYLNSEFWSVEKRAVHNKKISPFGKPNWNKSGSKKGGKSIFDSKIGIFAPGVVNGFLGKTHSKEVKTKISENAKKVLAKYGNPSSREEVKKKMSSSMTGRKQINNGICYKMVRNDELQNYLMNGWKLGRL
jgi:hypothetical protein